MKISGFTFVKNADKLYIPVKEAILSVLPICDEFIIVVGDNDEDDRTDEILKEINSDKLKIYRTVWDIKAFPQNTEFARQTDIAKSHCTGDWLFYIQADEAVHEQDLTAIKQACQDNLEDLNVDGFVLEYYHFWGNYKHYHKSHAWYKKEIRIIRNDPSIHSWKDAQSFRKFDSWEGTFEDFSRTEGTHKLKVKALNAYVYHYGHVRPPEMMTKKRRSNAISWHGTIPKHILSFAAIYDYGDLSKLVKFKGTHPAVMKDWIAKFDWEDQLRYTYKKTDRAQFKHEKLKYRIVSWIENNLYGSKVIGGFINYIIVK